MINDNINYEKFPQQTVKSDADSYELLYGSEIRKFSIRIQIQGKKLRYNYNFPQKIQVFWPKIKFIYAFTKYKKEKKL